MKSWIRTWLGLEDDPLRRAIALQRGGVYAIESDFELNAEALHDMETYFAGVKKRTGCEFVILDRGLHIATAEARGE